MRQISYRPSFRVLPGWIAVLLLLAHVWVAQAEAPAFKLASYNLEGYLLTPKGSRPAKAPEARAQVCRSILEMQPDVLALQEVGDTNALMELQAALKAGGLDLPHWDYVSGADPDIHLTILSRYAFSGRQPHTRDSFLLGGRRFQVCRGFAQVTIAVNATYSFTLIAAHLKSKRVVATGDEADIRLEEARILRGKIDLLLQRDPNANVVVLGDLNDTKDSASIRAVIGRGKTKLVDTRPAEQNGDNRSADRPGAGPRSISWTYYYAKEDVFSRIDYILLSPGMSRELQPVQTYVLARANWGLASDHRPLLATFTAADQ